MKRRVVALMLALSMVFGLAACGGNTATEDKADTTETTEAGDKEVPETTTIRWARGTSGNALVTIANKLGYFEEYGLKIEDVSLASTEVAAALASDKVDILSNYGTNNPLSQIAAGEDFTIFGGHMLTGCMPIVAKAGTEWNGIGDFVGKTIACPPNQFSVTGAMLREGYDPYESTEWLQLGTAERLVTVVNGEADYGVLGTGDNYSVKEMDDVEIMCYISDLTPDYSCCRMYTRTEFVENNPITIKLLLKALIRAQAYFEENREEVVTWMAEDIDATEEYVAAYMLDEKHYQINPDPIKNRIIDAWNILDETGFLDENAKNINIEDHINIELYQQALEELMADEEIYNSDKEFYDGALEYFKEQNL